MLFGSFSPSGIKIVLGLTWDWEICDRMYWQLGEMYCKAFLYLPDGGSFDWYGLQT